MKTTSKAKAPSSASRRRRSVGKRGASRPASAAPRLYISDRNGNYRPATPEQVIGKAESLLRRRVCNQALTSPESSARYLKVRLAKLEHEVFTVLLLDNGHRVIGIEEMFRGTIDGCSVHPREVVKACLKRNAAAVIFAHNHPSGIADPSHADHTITKRLKDALALIDVRVLDHLVLGDQDYSSFAQRGLL